MGTWVKSTGWRLGVFWPFSLFTRCVLLLVEWGFRLACLRPFQTWAEVVSRELVSLLWAGLKITTGLNWTGCTLKLPVCPHFTTLSPFPSLPNQLSCEPVLINIITDPCVSWYRAFQTESDIWCHTMTLGSISENLSVSALCALQFNLPVSVWVCYWVLSSGPPQSNSFIRS